MASIAIAACRDPGGPSQDPAKCQQTYEFGNYGCTRVVAIVTPSGEGQAANHRMTVRVTPIGEHTGFDQAIEFPAGYLEHLQLIRWTPGHPPADTVAVWVTATMRDQANVVDGMPSVVAVDSVRRVLRIGAVGALAPIDTVTLTLKSPTAASQ